MQWAQLLALAAGWTAWCALHSLLIWPPLQDSLQRRLGRLARGYRLGYNLLALLTLLTLLAWERWLNGAPLVAWPGPWLWVRLLLVAIAAGLLWAGARAYPLTAFLGLDALRGGTGTAGDELVVRGILRHVRHPWYLAGLLLLWCRELTPPALVTAMVLSLYLVLGAHLEEVKLLRRYGEAYAAYRRAVPMFFPRRHPRR